MVDSHFDPNDERERERRRRISASQQARFARMREQQGNITKKRCTDCKQYKKVEDFYTTKRHLVNGEYNIHPTSRCKQCTRVRLEAWIALHPDRVKVKQARLYQYNKAFIRAQNRERQGKQLREKSMKMPVTEINPKPFFDWVETQDRDSLDRKGKDRLRKAIEAYKKGEAMSFDAIDAIAVSFGHPEIIYILYGDN